MSLSRIICLLFLFVAGSSGEPRRVPTVQDVREPLNWIGPLRMEKIENFHLSGDWSPDAQLAARRISGLPPKEEDRTPTQVTFTLSHIRPRFSPDEEEGKVFGRIFSDGLKRLLDGKDFYAMTAHSNYGPPGTLCLISILSFDSYQRGDVQKEMIRNGFAIVSKRYSTYLFQNYGDDYRDELLRLEGDAKARKVGVWNLDKKQNKAQHHKSDRAGELED